MRKEGELSISSGFSRLDNTRLMKGALDNGGFGRATTFLRQDRQLKSGETIFVEGAEDEFDNEGVIVITNAGRPAGAGAGVGAGLGMPTRRSGRKSGKKSSKKSGKKSKKRPPAKPKKAAKKQSSKKKRAKKSAAKKR